VLKLAEVCWAIAPTKNDSSSQCFLTHQANVCPLHVSFPVQIGTHLHSWLEWTQVGLSVFLGDTRNWYGFCENSIPWPCGYETGTLNSTDSPELSYNSLMWPTWQGYIWCCRNAETQRGVWKISDISPKKENGGCDCIRAKFELSDGPTIPSTVAVQFACEGTTVSGIDFELVGTGYRLSLNKKRLCSGKQLMSVPFHSLYIPGGSFSKKTYNSTEVITEL
jgi:hypothetical protein